MGLPKTAKIKNNVVKNLLKGTKKTPGETIFFAFIQDGGNVKDKGLVVLSKAKLTRGDVKDHIKEENKSLPDKQKRGLDNFLVGTLGVQEGTAGTLQVNSIGKALPAVEKAMRLSVTKTQYKGAGFEDVKFEYVDDDGNSVADKTGQADTEQSAVDQPDTQPQEAEATPAADDQSDLLAKFKTRHATLQKLVAKVVKEHPNALSDADKQKIAAVLPKAQEYANSSDFKNATTAHDGVEQILTAAMKEVNANKEDPLALKWKSALETITPNLKQALADGAGDTQKMKTVLAYAKEKADAGEYTAAIKSLGALEMLINEGKAAASDPLTPWKETAKNAVFQINRLQFALRSYEKQLGKDLSDAQGTDRKKIEAAMQGSLKIAELLDDVVDELNSLPASETDVKKLSDYMKSDIVAAAEKPNPFRLKVDITGPVSKALQQLQTHFASKN